MSKLERDNELRRQRRTERKAMAIMLLGGKCVECGSTERLEFDHIKNDRNGLSNLISQMFTSKMDRLLKELEKCQLLCKSCHIQKSIVDNGKQVSNHGMLSMYMNKRCRCEDCRAAHAAHHREYMRKYRQRVRVVS